MQVNRVMAYQNNQQSVAKNSNKFAQTNLLSKQEFDSLELNNSKKKEVAFGGFASGFAKILGGGAVAAATMALAPAGAVIGSIGIIAGGVLMLAGVADGTLNDD